MREPRARLGWTLLVVALVGSAAAGRAWAQDDDDDDSFSGPAATALGPASAPGGAAAPPQAPPNMPAPAVAPSPIDPYLGLQVNDIQFTGNHQVQDDALNAVLLTKVGSRVSSANIAGDIRAIWTLNFFDDVEVSIDRSQGGALITYVLKEKPTIRKIYIDGNDEVGLDKINEVLDLKIGDILDLSKVKDNEEKIHDLYVSKGYYLAQVTSEVRAIPEETQEIDLYYHVVEHAKVEIQRITFVGNQALSDDDLKSVMTTSEGGFWSFLTDSGTYKEDAFQRDRLSITALYYDHGYINVKLGAPIIELSADKRYMYITVPIDEGPQYSFGKLDFTGDLIGPKDDYFSRLTIASGQIFNRSQLGNDIVALNDYYRDQGYAYVNITPNTNVDPDKRIVDLTFDIQKGSLVYFERIEIRGNDRTRDKVIRRELKVSEGELYNQTMLDLSKKRVQALGFFDKVDLSTSRGDADNLINVNIEVSERPTGTFQVGAGFSSVANFIAQAQISQNNLFGRGQVLSLNAQLSSIFQIFLVHFLDPYFLDSNWTFAFDLYDQQLLYPNFARGAIGGDLTWGYLFGDYLHLLLTYKLEKVSVSTGANNFLFGGGFGFGQPSFFNPLPQGAEIANLFVGGWTSALRGEANWDSRNDRMFPTQGFFHDVSVEVADPYIGSQNTYTTLSGFTRFYWPIFGSPFIFRSNIDANWVTSRNPNGVVITQRYFMGGVFDMRGFEPFSLSPAVLVPQQNDPTATLISFPIGGNLKTVANQEIEFPIFPKVGIRGVVFLDEGNAFNTEGRYCTGHPSPFPKTDPCVVFSLQDLRYDAGFGFRWFSPIGPLRFEWGLPLDRQPNEQPIVFQFTIGNFF
jgi:outer membrane protein insertion porin family